MREVSRFEAMQRGAIMAELVDGSMPHRCCQRTRCSIDAANDCARAAGTIHCFCGKACGQAVPARREGACFRAPRWIARVLSTGATLMITARCTAAAAAVRCAIVVR